MGPGEGIQRQRLIDLTTTLVDADQTHLYVPPQPQPRVRAKKTICFICWYVFFFVATTSEIVTTKTW